ADMPPEMQVALLRALEDREVRPVGSVRTVPVDVRIVTASARDLVDEVTAGWFREDLFHRLNVVRIEIPPLRERKEDIPLLVAHLLARSSDPVVLHPDVVPLLLQHDWPGNIRELDNALRAATALADGQEITPQLMAGILAQRRLPRRGPAPAPAGAHAATGPREAALLRALDGGWHSAPDLAARLGVSVRPVYRGLVRLLARGLIAT